MMRPRWLSIWSGAHLQTFLASPRKPHGHGFMAAMRMKQAGNVAEFSARELVMRLSSGGWRMIFKVRPWNSGNSSRKNPVSLGASVSSTALAYIGGADRSTLGTSACARRARGLSRGPKQDLV